MNFHVDFSNIQIGSIVLIHINECKRYMGEYVVEKDYRKHAVYMGKSVVDNVSHRFMLCNENELVFSDIKTIEQIDVTNHNMDTVKYIVFVEEIKDSYIKQILDSMDDAEDM